MQYFSPVTSIRSTWRKPLNNILSAEKNRHYALVGRVFDRRLYELQALDKDCE